MNPNGLPTLQECHFYHSMDLPGIGSVEGVWDLRGKFEDYIGNVDVSGKTVLDVGTASGFLTFEAEKRGAKVFSFDADGPERIQLVPPASTDPEVIEYSRSYFHGMRNSYRLAHHALKSQATPIYGDIYRMSEVVPRCDVVFVAQILVHLRDPIGALHQASLAAKEHLIVVEGVATAPAPDVPIAQFLGAEVPYAWWHLSLPLYQALLPKLGFSVTSVTTKEYTSLPRTEHKLTTIVARRV